MKSTRSFPNVLHRIREECRAPGIAEVDCFAPARNDGSGIASRHPKFFTAIPAVLLVSFSFSVWPQESEEESEDTFEHVQLWPIDDSHRVPSFAEFKREFLRAAETRDLRHLFKHVHDEIKTSLGGDGGTAEFREAWELDTDPENSKLWLELSSVLKLGCVLRQGAFEAPYLSVQFPYNRFEPHSYGVVAGSGVNLRDAPSRTARIIAQVGHLIVRSEIEAGERRIRETIGGETHEWIRVVLPSGQRCYVYGKYFRTPLDYRARFEEKDGTWYLTSFMAGD